MKISESTLEVLQNFSSINNGITVQTGNEIKTISPMKNIFGRATLSDNFTSQFSVYDLPEFLATISLLGDDAEFDFGEKCNLQLCRCINDYFSTRERIDNAKSRSCI